MSILALILLIILVAALIGVAAYLIMGTWVAFLIFALAALITGSVCLTIGAIVKWIIESRKSK